MNEFWDSYFTHLQKMDIRTIMEWGWYIFVLDLPRFLILEAIVMYWSLHRRFITKKKWDNAKNQLFAENPLVTILVPGHNEGKHLYKMVQSIQKQTYKNIEIIVVDDGSTDDTPIIGKSFENKGYITKFLRGEVRGGKASAANLGLRYSKGKYVVHIDADSSLEVDAVEKVLIPFYRYDNVGAVGGNLIVRNADDSLTTTMQFLEYTLTIGLSRVVLSKLGIYKIVSGAFGAFPMEVLNRVGGWDVGPGLDGDICVKIRKINYKILFEENAICQTHVPVTWKILTKQRLRWSRSIIRFRVRKHADVWNVFDRNFNILNFWAFMDNVFFVLILDLTWVFYMFKILVENPTFLIYWFPFKYTIYFVLAMLQFIIALKIVRDRKSIIKRMIYVPLFPIYMGYYMRIVRTISYIDELFFFDSYKDVWNPQKTSKKAREHGA